MSNLTEKQIKKKEYNKAFLEKQKSKKDSNVVNEELMEKLINEKANFFFQKQQTQTQQPVQPVPLQPQIQVNSIKQKILETLAVSSLGLIPIVLRYGMTYFYNIQKKPQGEQQQTAPNTLQTSLLEPNCSFY